jgi:sporulation integral membrane protein YlbJ
MTAVSPRRFLPFAATCIALVGLLLYAPIAVDYAKIGIDTCINMIIPSLFPLFVLSGLLTNLGMHAYLGRLLAPAMSRIFGFSGKIGSAFLIGITGGYPIGAAAVADLCRRGEISPEEAQAALAFCNNSGPAFIVGAAGVGIFKSTTIGLGLYGIQILSALAVGLLFAPKQIQRSPAAPDTFEVLEFSHALTVAMKKSLMSTVFICGYIVFFTVISGMLETAGFFHLLCQGCVPLLGISIQAVRSLFMGILELGTGISALSGLPATPGNLALCSFILGWGGISVHFQTLAMLSGTKIKTARHTAGRLLCGLIAALLSFVFFSLF